MQNPGPPPPPRPGRESLTSPPPDAAQYQRYPTPPEGYTGQHGQQERSMTQDDVTSADPGWGSLTTLLEKQTNAELQALLADPSLLRHLALSKQTSHPSHWQANSKLEAALEANSTLAARISHQESLLVTRREQVENRLLALHALERQWREQQASLDGALDRFSPQSLYRGLVNAVSEADAAGEKVVDRFIAKEGIAGDREVGEWIRAIIETRAKYWARKERKDRWDEGRVGGWR